MTASRQSLDAGGDDRLDDWVQGISPVLGHLEAFELPRGFPFDFSPVSLERLEGILLEQYARPDDVSEDDEQGLVEGVVAYVGEALLRVGGGSWAWQEDPDVALSGLPVVRPAEELGVAPISPLRLLVESVGSRGGREFIHTHAALAKAVDEYRAEHPSWTPSKQPTPGLDPIQPGPSEFLTAWLAERERSFPRWISAYAGAGTWDFSPETLDALEALVRRVVPTEKDLYDPAYRDFVDGVAWYLGEVMRRAKGGEWYYQDGEPDPYVPEIGRPYVQQPSRHGHSTVPILHLESMVNTPAVGYLRGRYAQFAR